MPAQHGTFQTFRVTADVSASAAPAQGRIETEFINRISNNPYQLRPVAKLPAPGASALGPVPLPNQTGSPVSPAGAVALSSESAGRDTGPSPEALEISSDSAATSCSGFLSLTV